MILGADILVVILSSVFAFLTVIMVLVLILMYAKSKLVPSGDVKIVVNNNDDDPIVVSPGSDLLSTLSNKELFLPSACGGGGTCAECKCQIVEGGGEVLPTEENHLTRKEQKQNWRLACQVKVRDDMKIKVPEEIFGIKKIECEVISNKNVASLIKEFVLKMPEGETLEFESGGYIQLYVPEYEVDWGKDIEVADRFKDVWDEMGLWDLKGWNDDPDVFRAYSMANHPAEGDIIKLNIRIEPPPYDRNKGKYLDVPPGLASTYSFTRKPGDKVTVSGPYGDFFIKPTDKEMVYIGGGAGMAPLRSHIFHLFKTMKTDRKVTYFYGGRSIRELFYTDEFQKIEQDFDNFKYVIALSDPQPEDNWEGPTGFIHQVALENYLKDHPEPEEIEYYLCGPPLMLQSALKMLDDLGVPDENIAFDDFGG